MSEARERPIIFSGPMVRAILDGRKTQTRRVVRGTPSAATKAEFLEGVQGTKWIPARAGFFIAGPKSMGTIPCPYGDRGDRLWVRETWGYAQNEDGEEDPEAADLREGYDGPPRKWRPSIFMPRWASRLTLEITDVRVQRVQEISEADAVAEGCAPFRGMGDSGPIWNYLALWDSLNAKRGFPWRSNPWVFAITFRRIP